MLEVKKSLIKDAGLGVFATQDINQGDLVSEYWGKYVDLTNGDFPDSDKLLAVDEKTAFCGYEKYKIPDKCGHFINDSSKINNTNAGSIRIYYKDKNSNVDLVEEKKKFYFEAAKNIQKGDELYFKYGIRYWAMKFNEEDRKLLLKNNLAFLLSINMHELIQLSDTQGISQKS